MVGLYYRRRWPRVTQHGGQEHAAAKLGMPTAHLGQS
uniref:Uncharacterized protein n=1 Tax=Arundo donax TaxID=35708 RepID=A0A0A8YDP1_ARUDO